MPPRTPARLLLAALLTASARAQAPCGDFDLIDVPLEPFMHSGWFEDVAPLPDGGAFAVGTYRIFTPPFDFEDLTLAMRWDGSAWTHTPTPYTAPYPGGGNDHLHAVAALGPDDVWAAGERYGDAGGLSVGSWLHVLHWDGSSWSEVDVPEPPGGAGINFSGPRVHDIAAFASDDVWFLGQWMHPNQQAAVTQRPLAMHWDGSGMSVADTPALYFNGWGVHLRQVEALAPDDIWGICRTNTASGNTDVPVVLHYDGRDWSQVDTPDLGESVTLESIAATSSDDVHVFGHRHFSGEGFALHFDGTGWTLAEDAGLPNTTGAALAVGPDAIWLGGELGQAALSLFDGNGVTFTDELGPSIQPTIRGLRRAGPCDVWAVGRRADGGQRPLAARMTAGTSIWVGLGAGLAGSGAVPSLEGDGELQPGTPWGLTLSDALPGAAAWLVLGASELMAPFKGGVLVPTPDVVLGGLVTDAAGGWQLGSTWPAGVPSAAPLYVQGWVQDAGAPAGLSASNGLTAVTP